MWLSLESLTALIAARTGFAGVKGFGSVLCLCGGVESFLWGAP